MNTNASKSKSTSKKEASKKSTRRPSSEKSQSSSRNGTVPTTKIATVLHIMKNNPTKPRSETIAEIAKVLKISDLRARAYYNTSVRTGKAPGQSYWAS